MTGQTGSRQDPQEARRGRASEPPVRMGNMVVTALIGLGMAIMLILAGVLTNRPSAILTD